MKADPASQRRLLALQAVDTSIAQLEHRVQTLPIHEVIKHLAEQRQASLDDHIAAETALSDAEAARAKAEADVVPVKERLARNEKRIHDGSLDAKALTGMIDEVAHLKTRIATLEDVELEAMEALEAAEERGTATADAAQAAEAGLRSAVEERDALMAEARAEMKGHRAQREAIVQDLPADLVTLYDKVRSRYRGIGAAELQGRRCTACGLEATTADYNRYVAAPPDEVLRCTEC
ncbi:MAG: nucleic acid-binding protein, partial [Propionibacteriaceae bacterium]|nr:nucleic acid-binding protein [Propionibacteriaceae bacterium]